jgi:GAF domain-containing protein
MARRTGHRTTLSVPLLRQGVAVGALLIRRTEVRPFSDNQIALLKTFADQGVIAIENVRLFTELQEKNRALTQAHAQVSEALEQQTATGEILSVISQSPADVQPVLDAVVESAVRLCGAYDARIWTLEGDRLIRAAGTGPLLERSSDWLPLDPALPSPRAFIERRVVHFDDIAAIAAAYPRLDTAVRQLGLGSGLATPLMREGQPIGVLAVRRQEPGRLSDKQVELLRTFADQAVIAIENVRLFTELQARNRDLTTALDRQTATADVLRIIAQSPTELQPVLDAIATSAVRLCAASDAVIERLEGDRFYNAAHAGAQMKGLAGLPLPLSRQFPGGRAILDRKPVILEDIHLVAQSEYPDTLELLKLNTIHSVAEIPLLSEGKPLGSLAVLRAEVRPFTEAEVALLKTFADQAVIAIENVRLFTELQEKNQALTQAHGRVTEALERQTATAGILKVISESPTDVQPVFDAIAVSASRLCDAVDSTIFRVDGDQLVLVAHAGPISSQPVGPFSALTPGRPSARAVLEARTIHVVDLQTEVDEYPEGSALARSHDFRTVLSVPLIRGADAIGVVAIRRTEARPFTDQQVELLQTFADQAVIAIENVRLFKELQQKNRALMETLEQQTATSEILRVISSSPTDVQPVFDAIVRSASRLCGGEYAIVTRYDGQLLHLAAQYNPRPGTANETASFFPQAPHREASITPRAFVDARMVHVPDVDVEDFELSTREFYRRIGLRAALAVPMIHEGRPIGVVSVSRGSPVPSRIVRSLCSKPSPTRP